MARKTVYWLGLGVVAAAAAWAVWMSWRTTPAADPEGVTDRVRILVGGSALVVLPWVGRRSGLFGPVGRSLTSRLARVAGCVAVGGLGISLVRLDRNAGSGGVLGSGHFSWPQEIAGLALLAAAATMPPVTRALKPQANASAVWGPAGMAVAVAFTLMPLQVLTVLYVAGILAATSRRSPVSSASLALGTLAGLATDLIIYGVLTAQTGLGLIGFVLVPALAFLVTAAAAGLAAAWLLPDAEDPQELRARRVRQGMLAGATAGVAGGLLLTVIVAGIGFLMIIGPLAGAAGGVLGGAFADSHPRKSLTGGSRAAGLFVWSR